MLLLMSDGPPNESRDPRGFRALRRRWREAPDAWRPLPESAESERAQLEALDADFDTLLGDPDARAFMLSEGPRRLGETVARVARWRRAFAGTPR